LGTTEAPGFGAVDIDVDGARVRLPPETRLDLGGVGKGMAADLVTRGLVDRGARSVLVSLGGDMRVRGDVPEGGWPVPVEDPLDDTRVAFVHPLAGGALVSSTRRIRSWSRGGVERHHIIDPRTGDSARTSVVAVVATATNAWWAEGIAKAVLIAGAEVGGALARDAAVHVWIFLDDGRAIEAA
jgi:thiamine biosynthesis lipoprotein